MLQCFNVSTFINNLIFIAFGLLSGILLTILLYKLLAKKSIKNNYSSLSRNKLLQLIEELEEKLIKPDKADISYKMFYEKFSDPILIIKKNKFINCNKATLKILKLNNKDQIYNIHPSSISPEYQPDGKLSSEKADEMIQIAYEKGSHFFEWVHIDSEHKPFTVVVYLTVINYNHENVIVTLWHNISSFRNSISNMKSTEKVHKKILNSFVDGVYICTPEYKIAYLNEPMIKEIGNAIGQTCYKAIYNKNEKCEWCRFDKLKPDKIIVYEYYNTVKDKYYQIKNTLLDNGSKLSIYHDITEVKKSENKLKVSEQQFRDFFDFSPLPMLIHSNGIVRIANNAALMFFETTDITKIIGKPVIDFIHPEQVEKVKQNLNREYKDGWNYGTVEHKLITLKNNIKYAEINGFLTSYENKPAIHIVINDVTEKKKTEQALKESEEKYKKLINDSSIGIGIFDNNNIHFANLALLKMFGYNEYDEFIKNPIEHYLSEESKILLQDRIDKNSMGVPIEPTTVFEIIRKDGQLRSLKIKASDIILNNKKLRHVTFIDVTERLKAEEELKNSEAKLKKTNAQKDKFFSILAHDLKNPFNTLLGFAELLTANHKIYDEQKRDKFLNILFENAKNIQNLIDNLLMWSRNQRNKIVYQPKQINLFGLISDNITLFTPTANNKKITVNSNVKKNIEAYADYYMVDIVIRNLLSNAIKFTPKNGTVTVSAKLKTNKTIEISVEDTGVGIPKEDIPKLFSLADNISTEGTDNEQGTGLGLILCKDFVEKNNGKIWVESKVGKGSKFFFTVLKKEYAN